MLYHLPFNTSNSTPPTEQAILIPTPKVWVKGILGVNPIASKIFATWNANDLTFLDYSPELWLFRFKPSYKRKIGTDRYNDQKKWVHPVHLDGTKHAGESRYSGQPDTNITIPPSNLPVDSPATYFYRPSEFTLPLQNVWAEIDIEPNKYFWARNQNTGNFNVLQQLYDTGDFFTNIDGVFNGRKTKTPIQTGLAFTTFFRFAIVINVEGNYVFSDFSESFKIRRNVSSIGLNDLRIRIG